MRSWIAACFVCCTVIACDSGGSDSSDASFTAPDAAPAVELDAGSIQDADVEPPRECTIVAPIECEQPAPTYADVEPVFERRCVGCHSGMPGGPWALTSYPHVASWFAEIRGAMLNCVMPPRDSGMTMPDSERDLVLMWLLCGYPP